ncbi:MAG: aldo/keto reductase [Lachnospiraceae bacterium]|nr:aldo/keto reductase [Lachnospiraceae bacterium]
MKEIRLNNGVTIPQIGFGTYKATTADGYEVVLDAIRSGYRHLDTAALYENEEDVGRAVRESGIPRDEFFITSKLARYALGYENTKREFEASLKKLGMEYIDLYLIHWPRPDYGDHDFDNWEKLDMESWRAMEELYEEGRIRAIGVSNFLPHHLENLMKNSRVTPAINQLELHPGYLQKEAVDFSRDHGIEIEAWSPIGRARLMNEPLLIEISEKYGISVARLCLCFDLQSGFIILPKSTHRERMEENLRADEINIEEEDMQRIMSMHQAGWSGEHPDRETIKP